MLRVAAGLGPLAAEVVFVGGSVTSLLVTDPGASAIRVTDDVDVIIKVTTRLDDYAFADRLRRSGLSECTDDGAPICRWVYDGILVDVMPTDGSVLGFKNAWFADALEHADVVPFTGGHTLRIISPPYFCCTKLEAFLDRGGSAYFESHDLEDVIAVVDGRPTLLDEVRLAKADARAFIADTLRTLLNDGAFLDALPGFLPGDAASQARLPGLIKRLGKLAAITDATPG